ncbi:MAG: tRNA (adenosine(37)-N6)-threonylcarbamoyltransferase complex ATPase subunit type 1 TsaE [bacterium]|nr:tRNA (adenosine(37)-N6)-threonylcarbamoyltransferase complex ATPase subunit type 1 TsaE [bacterium]
MEVALKNLSSNAYECTLLGLKDTQKLAVKLSKEIYRKGGPSIVALYGDLGSGKTTFTQFLAKALGVKEKILSPTFVIIKTFSLNSWIYVDQARMGADIKYKRLVHIDTYRLKSAKDLIALGLKDLLKDKENIVVIEWPEKIEKLLPKNTVRIYFSVVSEKERKVTIKIPNY